MGVLTFTPDLDQAGVGKLFEMMGEGWCSDGKFAEDIAADKLRGFGNFREDLITARIGQGLRYAMKLLVIHDLGLGGVLLRRILCMTLRRALRL